MTTSPDLAPPRGFTALWRRCIRPWFWLKIAGTTVLMSGFFIAYFHILRHPLRAPVEIPFTAADHWIGFHAFALLPYVSLWVYVCLPSSLMPDFRRLLGHALGALGLCLVGLVIFAVWPTSTPRVDLDWTLYPGMELIKSVDAGGNACPSLHAAFAVFACLWLRNVLAGLRAPRWLHALNVFWAVAILYSTIATRQHVAIDTLSGTLIGWLAAWINLRLVPAPAACSGSR